MFLFATVRDRLYNLLEIGDFYWTIFSRDLRDFAIHSINLRKHPL